MRLITDDLPEDLARPLLRYNIRFVEQFLGLLRDPKSAQNLASALGRPVDALQAIAERVRREHPELTTPEPSRPRAPCAAPTRCRTRRLMATVTLLIPTLNEITGMRAIMPKIEREWSIRS